MDTEHTDNNTRNRVLVLFWTFFKISALTVGGGFAMIPIIEEEFVRRKKWITAEDIADVIAIVQSVPGVIAANAAVFIGYRMAGFVGALAGVIGVVTPAFVVIVTVAACMTQWGGHPWLDHAFIGVRSGVCALIALSVYSMGKKIIKGRFEWGLVVSAFVSLVLFRVNPVWVIAAAALLGLAGCWWGIRVCCGSATEEGEEK